MERAILKGRSWVNGEERSLKITLFAAPATGGRARQRGILEQEAMDGNPLSAIETFLDTELPDNEDPA